MLTLPDLLGLTAKPRISDLEFSLLQEMYEKCLIPYAFDYLLSSGERVKLYFNPNRFCHLIGLEKVAEQVTRNTNIHNQHKGYKGWNRIKNGQLTLSGFRRFGGRHFDQLAKRKIVYFYSLPHLLMSGTAMVQYVPIPSSRLACKLIIFDQYDNSWVHLGLERESSVDAYYPRSFFIERISTASPDSRFVHGQPLVYSVTWKRRYNRYPVIRPYKKKNK